MEYKIPGSERFCCDSWVNDCINHPNKGAIILTENKVWVQASDNPLKPLWVEVKINATSEKMPYEESVRM